MKKVLLVTIIVLMIWAVIRFVVGGDEDTWICEQGQWMMHGNPSAPKPSGSCFKD